MIYNQAHLAIEKQSDGVREEPLELLDDGLLKTVYHIFMRKKLR